MQKYLLLIILLLPLLSCDKEADFRSSELHAPVVTGIRIFDENRSQGSDIGKPNDKDFDNPQLGISVYPNPTAHHFFFNLTAPSRAEAKVWLVQAAASGSLAAHSTMANATFAVIGGAPLLKADNLIVNGRFEAGIDVSALPEGMYRLYVQIDDQLAWRNIWVNRRF